MKHLRSGATQKSLQKNLIGIERKMAKLKKPKNATCDSSAPPRRCEVYIFLRV